MTEAMPELPRLNPAPAMDLSQFDPGEMAVSIRACQNYAVLYAQDYGAQCFAAGVAQGLYQAANIAALYSSGLERLHPDIPWDEMNEETKRIAHWTAQNIAAAIDAAIRKGE